jgi:signal transduction histidine kinase
MRSIVQRIPKRHAGRVWGESVKGVAAIFFVTLREQPLRVS